MTMHAPQSHDPRTIADAYLALWNEPRNDRRCAALAAGWTADARYIDPMMRGAGQDGIAAMIAGARAQFPGHAFALRGTPDGHGAYVRFGWSLAPHDGAAIAHGTDIVRLDADGRIAEVIGFLEGAAQ
jgi:hypothetical protein